MRRPLAFELLVNLPSAPPALTSQGWTWAQRNRDTQLLAAIAGMDILDDDVRAAAQASTSMAVRIAWLKRADVDVDAALTLCAADTRTTVWKAMHAKFPQSDALTARLLEVMCAKSSIGIAELVRDRVAVRTLDATALHAIVDVCRGRVMNRDTTNAWRYWFAQADMRNLAGLLTRADLWDVPFLDFTDLVLQIRGRDPDTLAADTAAAAQSASGDMLLTLTNLSLQRYLHQTQVGTRVAGARIVVDTLMAAAIEHDDIPSGSLTPLLDALDTHDHSMWTSGSGSSHGPAELVLAHLQEIAATTPMLADTIDGGGYTFRIGQGRTQDCWKDIRACLAHPEDDVAGYAWQLAYRSGMDLHHEFPVGVTRFRNTPHVWPYVRGLALCSDDADTVNFDADTLTALSYGATAALTQPTSPNGWHVANACSSWLPERLNDAGLWAAYPWPVLRIWLQLTKHPGTDHVGAFAWLTTQVQSCADPLPIWTVIDGISDKFTGTVGQLLAAGVEVCGQQQPAEAGKWTQPDIVLVNVG